MSKIYQNEELQLPDRVPEAVVTPPRKRKDPDWGLGTCPPEASCIVCEAMAEMAPSELKIMRNFYVEGTPVRIIAFSYDIPARQIYRHARKWGWDNKRTRDRYMDQQRVLRNIAMARYIQFQHLGAPNTPDKMLELLMKSEGMISNSSKVEVETEVAGRWEDRLIGLRQKTKVSVQADQPVVSDEDYRQYPGETE